MIYFKSFKFELFFLEAAMASRRLVKVGELAIVKYGHDLSRFERLSGSYPVTGRPPPAGRHEKGLVTAPGFAIGPKGATGAVNSARSPGRLSARLIISQASFQIATFFIRASLFKRWSLGAWQGWRGDVPALPPLLRGQDKEKGPVALSIRKGAAGPLDVKRP